MGEPIRPPETQLDRIEEMIRLTRREVGQIKQMLNTINRRLDAICGRELEAHP